MRKLILYFLLFTVLLCGCSKRSNEITAVNDTPTPTAADSKSFSKEEAFIKITELLQNNSEVFNYVVKYLQSSEGQLEAYNGLNGIEIVNPKREPITIENTDIKNKVFFILQKLDIVSIEESENDIEFMSGYGWAGIHDGSMYYGEEYGILYIKDGSTINNASVSVNDCKKIIDNWYFYSIFRM